jgi:hypothetical protein
MEARSSQAKAGNSGRATIMARLPHEYGRRVLICCVAVFLLGLLVRLAFLKLRPIGADEPVGIAISLATTGRYADAYGPGTGPTAHAAPLHPLLLSVLFKVLGTGTHGMLALGILASIESSLAFALLPALAAASRLRLACGALAGVGGAVLPVNFWNQTNGSFEAPLTAVMLVFLCLLLCRIWAAESFTTLEGMAFGLAVGVGCLTSPVLIPVVAAWSVTTAVRFRLRLRRVLTFLAVSALCCLALLSPWAIRNYRTLGALIWTRSNLGLELQISNNDLMTASLERNLRMPEYKLFHPYSGAAERAKVKALGEVAYQDAKRREALAWIGSHKQRFVALTAERFRLFWFPPMQRPWQTVFEAALTIVALSGLALMSRERCASAWIFAGAMAMYPAVYYVIQASPRYRLPLESVLFLLGAKTVIFLVTTVHRKNAESAPRNAGL